MVSVGKVNCCWPSSAQSIFISSPVGTNDHIFILSKNVICFETGSPFRREGGGRLLLVIIISFIRVKLFLIM
jgi:hypothetical protein